MRADLDHLVGSDDLICRLLTAVDAGAWARRDEGREDAMGALGGAARGKQRNGLEAWRLGGLEAWRLGGLEAWRLGGLEAWRLGGLRKTVLLTPVRQ